MLRVPRKADANYPQEPHLEGSPENAPHRIARTIALFQRTLNGGDAAVAAEVL